MDVYCRGATFEGLEEIYATIQDAFNANSQTGIRNAFKLMLKKPEDCRIIISKEMKIVIITQRALQGSLKQLLPNQVQLIGVKNLIYRL